MKAKNANIEGLRGLLMVWIILFHYTTRYGDLFCYDIPFGFENGGKVGVAMFFVISGYFLSRRLFDESCSGWRNVLSFDINKYWRLYPAYIISVILIYIVTDVCFTLPSREASLQTFLINCVLIWHPHVGYVDGAHWFIADLIKIQLALGFLFFIPKRRTPILMTLNALLLAIAYIKFLVYGQVYALIYLEVLCGITLYKAIKENQGKYWILALLTATYLIMTVHIILMSIYLVLFFALVYPSAINEYISKTHILNNRIIVYIGGISFSWYLVHQNIGYLIIGYEKQISYWGGVILSLAVTLLIAIMLDYTTRHIPKDICSYK